MNEEAPKKRKPHNRESEYSRNKQARADAAALRAAAEIAAQSLEQLEALKKEQLAILAARTSGDPTDADRDIDFAYRKSADPTVTPLMAPSLGAWQWYEFARADPIEFLKICAKREDAKAKAAGSISVQRMEDDKRQQFAVIDRIEKQLTLDVVGIVKELMEKFPEDVLRTCRKFDAVWKAFSERNP